MPQRRRLQRGLRALSALAAAAALALAAGPARASCGLDLCPLDAAPDHREPGLRLLSQTRHTAAPDGASWYLESFVGAEGRLVEGAAGELRLSGSLPVLWLRDAFGPWVGLGNAVALVDHRLPLGGEAVALALGTQLELPSTTRETHDDAGHTVLLPYLRASAAQGRLVARGRLGWARTLGRSADHDHAAGAFLPQVEVNPHSDSEVQARLGLGTSLPLGAGRLVPGVDVELIEELGEDGAFLPSLGPGLDLHAGPLRARLQAWLPLSPVARRFDHRVSLVLGLAP